MVYLIQLFPMKWRNKYWCPTTNNPYSIIPCSSLPGVRHEQRVLQRLVDVRVFAVGRIRPRRKFLSRSPGRRLRIGPSASAEGKTNHEYDRRDARHAG